MKGARGKRLQRLRCEKVERTFAHVLETGGARRTWLRGSDKVRKRYSLAAAAHNLGVVMRALFGIGTPRSLQQFQLDVEAALSLAQLAGNSIVSRPMAFDRRCVHIGRACRPSWPPSRVEALAC